MKGLLTAAGTLVGLVLVLHFFRNIAEGDGVPDPVCFTALAVLAVAAINVIVYLLPFSRPASSKWLIRCSSWMLVSLVGLFVGSLALGQMNPHFKGYAAADWLRWIDSLGDHAETRYPDGFSEENFRTIKPGLTMVQVKKFLGEPLDASQEWIRPEAWWDYSLPASNNWTYHSRTIFFVDGRVSRVDRSYYADDPFGY
jgi:hypothetical protein